jgi:hypothetical protein
MTAAVQNHKDLRPYTPPTGHLQVLYFFHFVKEQTTFTAVNREVCTQRTPSAPCTHFTSHAHQMHPGQMRGGSGWSRTNDPRLIKTVL